jgi:hypothetical protein
MATTVNNTTINSKLTIIFDADINKVNSNDGPVSGTGNTESDVIIDSVVYYNLRSHTEVPTEIHALQWNATTNTGWLEYTDDRNNLDISELPSWASNVVIRCEAEDEYKTTLETEQNSGDASRITAAETTASDARVTYLSNNSIIY